MGSKVASNSIGAMVTREETSNIEAFITEQGPIMSNVKHENGLTSAHTIDHGMFTVYIQLNLIFTSCLVIHEIILSPPHLGFFSAIFTQLLFESVLSFVSSV